MEMKQECIVLYTQPYSIKDDASGKVNEGISIHYLASDNMNPCERGESRGIKPGKDTIALDKKEQIKQVPGMYEIVFDVRPGTSGKLEMRTKNLNFVREVEIM